MFQNEKAHLKLIRWALLDWQSLSERRGLNSRPSPWQGDALPLSYFRKYRISLNLQDLIRSLLSFHTELNQLGILYDFFSGE